MPKSALDELFTRYQGNPILGAEEWPYRVNSVFNPGAVLHEGKVLLFPRVEARTGFSHLTVATSIDGKTEWHIDAKPTLEAEEKYNEAKPGFEDARIVFAPELKEYLITCTSFMADDWDQEPFGISLIGTKDFKTFRRISRCLLPDDKDGALFPRRINGKWVLVHRPFVRGKGHIWCSVSPDLEHWGRSQALLKVGKGTWDNGRIGIGPPPIETEEGWLIIYHGVRDTVGGDLYRIGLALLDLDTLEVIRRSAEWIFRPHADYEVKGDVGRVVFPCGAVVCEDTLFMYYGGADTCVCLATSKMPDILTYLKRCPKD